jgi:hypothetical protein
MNPRSRHRPVIGTPIFTVGSLAAALILVSPAAVDELVVKNNAKKRNALSRPKIQPFC